MAQSIKPLVSIVIPSFNQGRFIRETIQSCLDQDYRPIEILVLDGGSTDATVDVLKSFSAAELQWWSERDKGVVDAVNKGMAKARGDFLSIQSSDDVFLPGAVAAAVAALAAHPEAGMVYGDVELIDQHSEHIGQDIQGEFDFCDYLGRLQYIPQPGTCFTRAAMVTAGGWRDNVSYAADADFWMRIASGFPVLKLSRTLGRYRYHDEQRDAQRSRIARDWVQAIDDLIAAGKLTARQRRYARMGQHLARYRYAPDAAWWPRTLALYRALLCNPAALLDRRFPKRELLPGREPIWRMLSRAKRAMGFKARSG